MNQTCMLSTYWMLAIQRRGGEFAGVKGDAIYFYIKRGSELDDEENLRTLREFLKNYYSYTLKVAFR